MLTIMIALIIGILLLRIRLRLNLETDRKTAFLGLGKSGITYDFRSKQTTYTLFRYSRIKPVSDQTNVEGKVVKEKSQPKKKKMKRVRPLKDIIAIIPKASKAIWKYNVSLLKSVIVEELQGDIKAGFDSPDITGQVYGYYQAAFYAVPAVVGRIRYQPVWDETTFEASLKASVAIPLYTIVYRSIILFFSLPLRDIIKITIGRKERSHDG